MPIHRDDAAWVKQQIEVEERRREAEKERREALNAGCMWLQLPDEIWVTVLVQGLSLVDTLHCGLACRRLNMITRDGAVWQRLYLERWVVCPVAPDDFNWLALYMRRVGIDRQWRKGKPREVKSFARPAEEESVELTALDLYESIEHCHIISGYADGALCVWNINDASCIARVEPTGCRITCVAVSANVCVAGAADGRVSVYDPESATLLGNLEPRHTSAAVLVAVQTDGIYTAHNDGTISVHDRTSRALVRSVATAPDLGRAAIHGSRVVASCSNSLRMVDAGGGALVWTYALAGAPFSLAFDGDHVAVGEGGGAVTVLDAATGALRHRLLGHGASVLACELRGPQLVTTSADHSARRWDLTTGAMVTLYGGDRGHKGPVLCVQSDEDKIVTGSADHSMIVWDRATGTRRAVLSGGSLQEDVGGRAGAVGLRFSVAKVLVNFRSHMKLYSFAPPPT